MGDVVNLMRPLNERILLAALDEITNDRTDAVILVTEDDGDLHVRTFGPNHLCIEALRRAIAALEAE